MHPRSIGVTLLLVLLTLQALAALKLHFIIGLSLDIQKHR
jgi:hypothetical protein